jgi:hypothetical protein
MKTSLKDFASCELDELFEGNGLLLINYLIIPKLENIYIKKMLHKWTWENLFFHHFLIPSIFHTHFNCPSYGIKHLLPNLQMYIPTPILHFK